MTGSSLPSAPRIAGPSGSGKEPDIGVPRRSSRFRADLMLTGHEAFHHA